MQPHHNRKQFPTVDDKAFHVFLHLETKQYLKQ